MEHIFGDIKGQLNKIIPPKSTRDALTILKDETGEFEMPSRLRGDVLDAMKEYAKKKNERINELEEKNKELHELCSLVYHSFGGGLVMTFNEDQVELFREATGN